jgi:hypothetical protein
MVRLFRELDDGQACRAGLRSCLLRAFRPSLVARASLADGLRPVYPHRSALFCAAGISTCLVHMQDGDTLTAKSDFAASTGVLGQVRVAE